MVDLFRQYLGANYENAKKNLNSEKAKLKEKFTKNHPHADVSKFEFEVDVNKNEDVTS